MVQDRRAYGIDFEPSGTLFRWPMVQNLDGSEQLSWASSRHSNARKAKQFGLSYHANLNLSAVEVVLLVCVANKAL
jgi:hypothetical protein